MASLTPFAYSLADINFDSAGSSRHDSLKAYSQSKRANLLFAQSMHDILNGHGIQSMASHPGYTRTSLFSNNWHFAPKWFADFVSVNPIMSMSSQEGAMISVRALHDEYLGSGCYLSPFLWAVGPPIASCPRPRRWYELGREDVVYPFLGTVPGGIWGGWDWSSNDVAALEEWTSGVTGMNIS